MLTDVAGAPAFDRNAVHGDAALLEQVVNLDKQLLAHVLGGNRAEAEERLFGGDTFSGEGSLSDMLR
jgi:hypothetical protein